MYNKVFFLMYTEHFQCNLHVYNNSMARLFIQIQDEFWQERSIMFSKN